MHLFGIDVDDATNLMISNHELVLRVEEYLGVLWAGDWVKFLFFVEEVKDAEDLLFFVSNLYDCLFSLNYLFSWFFDFYLFSAVNILYLVFWALNNIIQVFVIHQLGLLAYLTVSYLIFLAYFLLDFKLRLLEIEILCVVWNNSDILQVGMHNITFAPQDDLFFWDAKRFGEVEAL